MSSALDPMQTFAQAAFDISLVKAFAAIAATAAVLRSTEFLLSRERQ
jgi:hypothetical protein